MTIEQTRKQSIQPRHSQDTETFLILMYNLERQSSQTTESPTTLAFGLVASIRATTVVGTIATVGIVWIRIVLGRPIAGLGVCVAVCGVEAGNRVPSTILPLPLDVPTGLRRSGRYHSMSVAFLDKRLGPEGGILGVVPVAMESHAGVVTIRGVPAVLGTMKLVNKRRSCHEYTTATYLP